MSLITKTDTRGYGAEDFIDALKRLRPLIDRDRAQFDQNRRLTDDVFNALADAGLFRLWTPRALGGPELCPLDFMRVVETAAALDGSVGWLVGNGGGMSRAGGYLPESVARKWFADPRAFIVASTASVGRARPAPGGYQVSGHWRYGSGSAHGGYFMGLAAIEGLVEGDAPSLICCYVARDQVTIHDTWRVSGLRGTSSGDFSIEDVFVPAERTHAMPGLTPTQPGLLYRLPPRSIFPWTVAVVPLGIAQGAIDAFVDLAQAKPRAGASMLLRDSEIVQATVGRATALLRSARAFMIEAMMELMAATDDALVGARVTLRAATAHAAETAVRIADMLAAEAGGAAIAESCPLERFIRDVQASVKHIAMTPTMFVTAGRMRLGLDTGGARF